MAHDQCKECAVAEGVWRGCGGGGGGVEGVEGVWRGCGGDVEEVMSMKGCREGMKKPEKE